MGPGPILDQSLLDATGLGDRIAQFGDEFLLQQEVSAQSRDLVPVLNGPEPVSGRLYAEFCFKSFPGSLRQLLRSQELWRALASFSEDLFG